MCTSCEIIIPIVIIPIDEMARTREENARIKEEMARTREENARIKEELIRLRTMRN